jgi:hypothetical protein
MTSGISIVKAFIRKVSRMMGYEIRRIPRTESDLLLAYEEGGRIPWSPGYAEVKQRLIEKMLREPDLHDFFQGHLPDQFGIGFDERCVEYPWFLSQTRPGPERLLDAGSALNHAFLLDHFVLKKKKLDILTLSPEQNCFWQRGISYLYGDLRSIPIVDCYYDAIACISTLEHIGLNNVQFVGLKEYAEEAPDDYLVALLEMRRVLRPGGTIFITIPYGKYHNFGSFQQFDAQHVERIIAAFGPNRVQQTYFRYASDGWKVSTAGACGDSEYVNWIMIPPHLRPSFPDHPDRAAAARSVVCLSMVKPSS